MIRARTKVDAGQKRRGPEAVKRTGHPKGEQPRYSRPDGKKKLFMQRGKKKASFKKKNVTDIAKASALEMGRIPEKLSSVKVKRKNRGSNEGTSKRFDIVLGGKKTLITPEMAKKGRMPRIAGRNESKGTQS